MSVEIEFNEQESIIILVIGRETTIDQFKAVNDTQILPWVRDREPETVHLIGDMSRIEWSFPDFMQFVNDTNERRKKGEVPTNLVQHLVGTDAWINNWRTVMQKRYGVQTSAFTSIEDALNYVRGLK